MERRTLKPPQPTHATPYAQIDWLCERFIRRYKNTATKKTVLRDVQAYKKLLRECDGYDSRLAEDHRFILSIHCDQSILQNAADYWRSKHLSPFTVVSRLNTLRALFVFAAEEHLTASSMFFVPARGELVRATSIRTAYADEEFQTILRVFGPVYDYAKRVAAGYRFTGLSAEPDNWTDWDKVVWYFENEMKGVAIPNSKSERKKHYRFFRGCANYHGGVNEVYRRLGVSSLIDVDLIAPLAMKLSWETGLNTESLLTLKRNCLSPSHPLYGFPYIRYFKARSGGEKDLLLNLFDGAEQSALALTHKQSGVISKTIDLILKLTEPLIQRARPDDQDYLFLYESWTNIPGKPSHYPVRLTAPYFYQWSHNLRARLKKAGEKTLPDVLNLGRFRPTKILQLVRAGKDFTEIQAIAGHSSAAITLRYLASHHIAPQAVREVSAALKRIHENAEEFKETPKPYATSQTIGNRNVIYKGMFCDCKDIFSPPKSVRRLPTFREGQSCTYFNMCLLCPNVLITKKHLPQLIGYQQEVKTALSHNACDAPNTPHYEKTLAVLDGIMREFTEEEISWAKALAETGDYYIDSFTHRSVS